MGWILGAYSNRRSKLDLYIIYLAYPHHHHHHHGPAVLGRRLEWQSCHGHVPVLGRHVRLRDCQSALGGPDFQYFNAGC